MVLVFLITSFSGCSRPLIKPDEPFEGVEFIDRYDYVYFPLNVDYKRGEVLGQAFNENHNKHELYYALEGVDPDVMIYLQRGSKPSGLLSPPNNRGMFFNPDKIDLLLDAFQPSGMKLTIGVRQSLEDKSASYHNVCMWIVTQEVWDAWKASFHAALAEDAQMNIDEYYQKQLDLYQELEKRILVTELSVIRNFCRELFLPRKEADDVTVRNASALYKTDAYAVSLQLNHYRKNGTFDLTWEDMWVTLERNEKKDWIWYYNPYRTLGYEIPLDEDEEKNLTLLMREASACTEQGSTPDSEELFDFWSAYFPEDKLPPIFSFPGLGELVPET